MTNTRELDGSSAGGQFLRTALALSVLEGDSIRIEHVRGDRPTPGLRHQHLAVLETMAELTDAEVSGAEVGAETVEFAPGRAADGAADRPIVAGGTYEVSIGTAGSITLLFDAILALATVLESPLSITASGGTDVKWSPPIDYVTAVKLPLLRRLGFTVACEVHQRGFYPDGGGRATLHLAPSKIDAIDLTERGSLEGVRCYSTEATDLADRDVAHRQAEGALERLDETLESTTCERRETTATSACPGSAVVLRLEHGTGVAGFTALGERGTPAERVGEAAANAANRFFEGDAPVDRHLGDQLLVVLALAGGRLRVPSVTDHVAASCDLLESFDVPVDRVSDGDSALLAVDPRDALAGGS
ncbi:RNA 3'-terminal phosphate cyclase [Natrarchaeobaculum sulfurireducens]|uniref:RNA 3'-terminal phosphate cyclase n=1 Tax=Natrarchaeobaculum sulfurireducens TaxID=2044521 RepID=A0A346PC30_9EURY|nr:RNA 3'-terminal phosphate cyclase [Natrarchaeobaculum sulfurireducens]AXR77075.1 RNA 3'-terminal phosphate cyclase [Natrarchaeobaculum sulfurireducens]AXR82958.1 RNA 3'-terminal phosphate cyclase [Natrarchaeobaculum sulfurireducens]